MSHKASLDALDRWLKEMKRDNRRMSNTCVLLTGDFRQTLPVVKHGNMDDQVAACFKSSHIWRSVRMLSLRINMRAHLAGDDHVNSYSETLLSIGEIRYGQRRFSNDRVIPNNRVRYEVPINIASIGVHVESIESLFEKVYDGFGENRLSLAYLADRSILAVHNRAVDELNEFAMNIVPGEAKTFLSIDKTIDEDDSFNFPTELLNSVESSGLPKHKLILKEGTPVMLMRNLYTAGLVNGLRLLINKIAGTVIECKVITGPKRGETVFIPQIPLTSDPSYPIKFERLQFPLKPCYSMTINKSQGQTLKRVGLCLKDSLFAHGQLYVGMSRVGRADNLFILAPGKSTINVVNRDIIGRR